MAISIDFVTEPYTAPGTTMAMLFCNYPAWDDKAPS